MDIFLRFSLDKTLFYPYFTGWNVISVEITHMFRAEWNLSTC